MNFDDVIRQRRSVRSYDNTKLVTKAQIMEMIKSAQMAPSWKNSQTGRYYAIFNPEKLLEVPKKKGSLATSTCLKLAECAEKGVVFHHAGLLMNKRKLLKMNSEKAIY